MKLSHPGKGIAGLQQLKSQVTQGQLLPVVDPDQELKPGTLIIRDQFSPSGKSEGVGHGELVAYSAFQQGFKGDVLALQRQGHSHEFDEVSARLASPGLGPEETLKNLDTWSKLKVTDLVDSESTSLERSSMWDAKNTVTNISAGMSKARITQQLYDGSVGGLSHPNERIREQANNLTDNLATAFSIDPNAIRSEDAKLSGAARHQFQQKLLNRISDNLDSSPTVAESSARWDQAVNEYEAGNNSVVIASGNAGQVKAQLEKANGGRSLQVPADFEDSYLENDSVTSVGASQLHQEGGKTTDLPAVSSNRSTGTDLYASGTLGLGDSNEEPYSSFSAPKVGTAMAQLHKDNPQLSSTQVENLMKQSLTYSQSGSTGSAAFLDQSKTLDFLKNSTF